MAKARTEFFEGIIGDKNISEAQVVTFFRQAYFENEGDNEEQLRLLELVTTHRPELDKVVARSIIRGY